MSAYVLDRRHSERQGFCDVHRSSVSKSSATAKLVVRDSNGVQNVVSLCRPCARALARNARLHGEP